MCHRQPLVPLNEVDYGVSVPRPSCLLLFIGRYVFLPGYQPCRFSETSTLWSTFSTASTTIWIQTFHGLQRLLYDWQCWCQRNSLYQLATSCGGALPLSPPFYGFCAATQTIPVRNLWNQSKLRKTMYVKRMHTLRRDVAKSDPIIRLVFASLQLRYCVGFNHTAEMSDTSI